jgi:hypothetical protein
VARFIYFVIYLKFKVNERGGWGNIYCWEKAGKLNGKLIHDSRQGVQRKGVKSI